MGGHGIDDDEDDDTKNGKKKEKKGQEVISPRVLCALYMK